MSPVFERWELGPHWVHRGLELLAAIADGSSGGLRPDRSAASLPGIKEAVSAFRLQPTLRLNGTGVRS